MTTQNWFAEAPPLPFVPFRGVTKEELCVLFTGYRPLTNRKRHRSSHRLAQAMVCFFATTSALIATSREGEERITAWVPAVKQTMDSARIAMLGSSERQLSLNELGH
jgi:hypothetical protein